MPDITYKFHAIGAADVKREFDDIETRARQAKRNAGESSGSPRAQSPAAQAAREKRQQEAIARAAARDKARAEAREQQTSQQRAERAAREQARAQAVMHRAAQREERRHAATMARERQRQDRQTVTSAKNTARESLRWERQRHTESRRMATQAQRQRRAQQREGREGLSDFMGAGGLGGIGLAVGAAGFAAGSYLVKQGFDHRLKVNELATRLSISARGKGEAGVAASELIGGAEQTARDIKGSKAEDILAGQSAYVARTGDLKEARAMSRTFTMASMATGATNESIATTAATLRDKFGIHDETGMQGALATLIGQGKSGAFEMSDMASYVQEMGASAARYGLKGEKGVGQLGALAQIARASTGSGAEAATSVEAMFRQLIAKGARGKYDKEGIERLTGVQVFKDKNHTQTKDIMELLPKIIGGAKGDLGKLQKIFDERGVRAVSGLIEKYNEASSAMGKGATAAERQAAGEAAVTAELRKAQGAAGEWSEVVKDAAAAGESYQAKMESASEQISSAFGKAIDPVIQSLAANVKLFTVPLEYGADKLAAFMTSLGDVTTHLGKLFGMDDATKGEISGMTASEAAGRMLSNQKELDALNEKETRFGRLTSEDAEKRGKLLAQKSALAEQIDSTDPTIRAQYLAWQRNNPHSKLNEAEWMAQEGLANAGYKPEVAKSKKDQPGFFQSFAEDVLTGGYADKLRVAGEGVEVVNHFGGSVRGAAMKAPALPADIPGADKYFGPKTFVNDDEVAAANEQKAAAKAHSEAAKALQDAAKAITEGARKGAGAGSTNPLAPLGPFAWGQ